MSSLTTLGFVRRIGEALDDPAVELGLEVGLSPEATLWVEDVPGCPASVVGRPTRRCHEHSHQDDAW